MLLASLLPSLTVLLLGACCSEGRSITQVAARAYLPTAAGPATSPVSRLLIHCLPTSACQPWQPAMQESSVAPACSAENITSCVQTSVPATCNVDQALAGSPWQGDEVRCTISCNATQYQVRHMPHARCRCVFSLAWPGSSRASRLCRIDLQPAPKLSSAQATDGD